MAKTYTKHNRIAHAMALFTLVGIASLCTGVMIAFASGIAPSEVIALANSARVKENLPTLKENTQLSQAAEAKAEDMIKNDYFAHTSPKGIEPWYWIKQAGYQYQAAGENLAINYTDVKEQHSAWMKSATHRANILNTRYQEIGVAVAHGKINGKDTTVTVEFFGSPLSFMADRVVAVPPIAVPAPEIKGIETPVIPVSDIPPTVPAPSVPVPVRAVSDYGSSALSWQETIWLALLLLSVVSAPLALFARSLGMFVKQPVIQPDTAQHAEDEGGISVTALYSDSIHHRISTHRV